MSNQKVLVLGATGPAGLCLLRELLFRNHPVVAYVRNPSKIPSDLSSSSLLSVVKGEMSDLATFAAALSGCVAVISLLGPNIADKNIPPTLYGDMYRNTVAPAMRKHGVTRIFAMNTIAISQPEDSWTLMAPIVRTGMKLLTRGPLQNVLDMAAFFENEARDLDWTIFRIAAIPGEPDDESWRTGRGEGEVYVGPLGGKGWSMKTNRSRLARWLVDGVEGGAEDWIRKMPAVTRLA